MKLTPPPLDGFSRLPDYHHHEPSIEEFGATEIGLGLLAAWIASTSFPISSHPNTSHTTMSPTATIFHSFLLFFFFILLTLIPLHHAEDAMLPLIEPRKTNIMSWMLTDRRRKLNGFQICSLCTCCNSGGGAGAGGGKYCTPSPCCYAINCNIPNRPFGLCSFTPKSCNCFGCHL